MMADNNAHHLGAVSLDVGSKSESGVRKRHRKPNLARALHEAKKAGVNVAGATLTADGSVSLSFGEAVKTPGNELDQWITAHENPTKGH
jgi:hypothetical protein